MLGVIQVVLHGVQEEGPEPLRSDHRGLRGQRKVSALAPLLSLCLGILSRVCPERGGILWAELWSSLRLELLPHLER